MSRKGPKAKIAKLTEAPQIESIAAHEPSSSFASPRHFSDVVLVIEGQKFHVHKCILSMNSPVFETMFTADFKEKSAKEIELDGKSAKEFEVLLKILYNNTDDMSSMIEYENFEFLLELANYYQIDKIKKSCHDYVKSHVTKENCLHFCKVAAVTDYKFSDELKQDCVAMAKWLPLSTIEKSPHYAQMDTTLNNQILIEKVKVLETFKEVLDNFYSTCCDLVKTIYCCAATWKIPSSTYGRTPKPCYSKDHPPRKQPGEFAYDCLSCKRNVDNDWPSSSPYRDVQSGVKNLHSLLSKYENFGEESAGG